MLSGILTRIPGKQQNPASLAIVGETWGNIEAIVGNFGGLLGKTLLRSGLDAWSSQSRDAGSTRSGQEIGPLHLAMIMQCSVLKFRCSVIRRVCNL